MSTSSPLSRRHVSNYVGIRPTGGGKAETAPYEEMLELVGGFGWYQFFMLIMFFSAAITIGGNNGFMVFGRIDPPKDASTCYPNRTCIGPVVNGTYGNDSTSFATITQFYSVAIYMNLTGSRSYIPALMMSVQLLGMLFGSLIAGQVSDSFGRKPTFIIAACGVLVSGIGSVFCTDWQTFMAARFFIGFCNNGLASAAVVLLQEYLLPRHRMVYQIAGMSLGYVYAAMVAMIVRNWKDLSLIIQVPTVLALIMALVVSESPKWMIEKGQLESAVNSLKKVSRWNHVRNLRENRLESLIEHVKNEAAKNAERRKHYTYCDLCYSRKAVGPIIALIAAWNVSGSVYYGMLYNIGSLSGDVAINSLCISTARISVQSTLYFTERCFPKLGRRLEFHIGFGGIAIALGFIICSNLFPEIRETAPMSATVAAIIGIAFMGILWPTVYTVAVELFPTVLRNMGFSLCTSTARIGAALGPQILLLNAFWAPAPFIVLEGLIAIAWLLVAFLLPETRGQPLPDLPHRNTQAVDDEVEFQAEDMKLIKL